MSCAEVEEPTTMHFLPRWSAPEVNSEECKTGTPRSPRDARLPAPLTGGEKGKPDMPVASTRCLGRNCIGFPSRKTSTFQDPSSYCACRHSVEVQQSSSITRVYISSQSAILSLG